MALIGPGPARADTTPLAKPATCVDDASGVGAGTVAWSTATSAQSDTDAGAAASTSSLTVGGTTHYLKCTGYGFSVPKDSVIDSITLQANRQSQGNPRIGDLHVYAVAPGQMVGSGTSVDKAITPCTSWTQGAFTADTYTDPMWGISWAACASSNVTCGTAFNVNHAGFGAALAAQHCPLSGAATGLVDWMKVQVAYTVTPCAGANWTQPVVTVSDTTPNAMATYTINTAVPNVAGCALDGGAIVQIPFPAGTNISGATATWNGMAVASPAILGQTLQFTVPASGFNATCAGQPCVEIGTAVSIVVSNVTNPVAGSYTLTVSASPSINGNTGTTPSASYTIIAPCVSGASGSAWGPINVTQDHSEISLTDCPRFARYTIQATTPAPGGCELVPNVSQLVITLPTGSSVASITSATVNGMSATIDITGAPSTVKLTPTVPVNAGTMFPIVLDVVQNPTAAGAQLTIVATATKQGVGSTPGGTATGTSAAYGSATTTCGPALDFYVRDWTMATAYDDGHVPSSTNSMGVAEPDWARSSDVWNQNNSTVPTPGEFEWVQGADPVITGSNFAFARVSLATTGAELTYRPVTVEYLFAPFGMGMPFAPIGGLPMKHVLASNVSRTVLPGTSWTVPTGVPAGTHSCLAVQISSVSDAQKTGTLNGQTPGPTDPTVRGDDNKAQRNVTVQAVPPPPPPPPPPPSPGSAGGKMWHFAMAHNAGTATSTMVVRMDVSKEAKEHLRDLRAAVVGGESMPLEAGGTIRLADIKPGEIRWLGITYSVASGAEGTMIPVGFSEMDGNTVVNAATFGITPSPIASVVRKYVELHRDVFGRLATAHGIAEGKTTAAAASALLKDQSPLEERYVRFLKEQQRLVDAAVSKLLRGQKNDPFDVRTSVRELFEAVGSGYVPPTATAHLTLLEKLDSFMSMIELAKGNPLDILQMVKWQRELYTTVPQLKALDVSAEVVKESDAFIAAFDWRKANAGGYADLIGRLMKSFHATAGALAKAGVNVAPELAQMQKQRSTGPLEKAHRDFLLKLDGLRSSAAASRS